MGLDLEMIQVYYKNESVGPEGKYKTCNWRFLVENLVQSWQLNIIFDLPAKYMHIFFKKH